MPGLYLPQSLERARRAADHYLAGIIGYHQALAKVKLPPRGVKGSEQNMARVHAVALAMHQARLSK